MLGAGFQLRSYILTCAILINITRLTKAEYRPNCLIQVSNCALDENCDGNPYRIDFNGKLCDWPTLAQIFSGATDQKSLRFDCRIFKEDKLDMDVIKHIIIHIKELYMRRVVVYPMPDFTKFTKIEIRQSSFYERAQAIGECRDLETLEILETRIEELPEDWLGNCTKLRSVLISYVEGLQKLPARMLHSATQLRSLTIQGCNLIQLPSDLISNTPELRALDLSYNYLHDLPKGFFKNTPHLERLKLMARDPSFDAQDEFYHLTDINFLMLDSAHKYGKCRNEILRNGTYQTFPFNTMPKLEYLSLEWTEATQICPEWSELFPSLKRLDLRDNRIGTLKYEDVELIRNNGWEVDLATSSSRATMMGAIEFTESDYNAALQSQGNSSAKILINKYFGLMCNCRWYWMIRTLKAKPGYISLEDAGCWWADPPGSYNRIGAPFADVPEWKLGC